MKDALNKNFGPVEYKHSVKVYVPVFQTNPENDNDGHPAFTYKMADASGDINAVLIMKPDYILVLKGDFDAKTQPFDLAIVRHNSQQWMDENF